MHIFDCDPTDERRGTDITFGYNANFVLYVSLEHERLIAQARGTGPQPAAVLTGVPVAGVAYLDRPEPAGYFIFPDLSVRHEGRYRLNFHLYEEIKNPKDADKDAPPMPLQPLSSSLDSKIKPPQNFLHFRLDVKSKPFSVYSAKRFPGLGQSTALSRIIAEQGCRVRIRRDIRMRRRGEKRIDDYEMDERMYAQSDRYATPDPYVGTPIERPRSTSTSDPSLAYSADYPRRPSMPDDVQYAQPYARRVPPAPPQWGPVSQYPSHLAFGVAPYQRPQLPPTPPPAAPIAPYSPQTPYYPPRYPSNGAEYGYVPAYPHPQQPAPASAPTDPLGYQKGAELPRTLQPLKPMNAHTYGDTRTPDHAAYPTESPPALSRSQTPGDAPRLPPIKVPEIDNISQPASSISSSPGYDVAPKGRLYEIGSMLTKRTHEESFGPDNRALYNGMRPDAATYPVPQRKESYPSAPRKVEMREYRRANGSVLRRMI